jgi:hypothetical protein
MGRFPRTGSSTSIDVLLVLTDPERPRECGMVLFLQPKAQEALRGVSDAG